MIRKLVDYVKETEFRFTVFSDRIYILNYQEILSLEDDRICLTYDAGRMVIKGEHLTVGKLLDQEMLIFGKVLEIEMSRT